MIEDHLSVLEMKAEQEKETEIRENIPDELLFMLSIQKPWYADIVNYLAC